MWSKFILCLWDSHFVFHDILRHDSYYCYAVFVGRAASQEATEPLHVSIYSNIQLINTT